MQLNEIVFKGQPPIDGYGSGFFRVGEAKVEGPLLVLETGPVEWGGLSDLAPILGAAVQIDVLFFGMGAEIAHLPPKVREKLEEAEIAYETMASPAACRTYNVLLSEGRRVALAVLPVD